MTGTAQGRPWPPPSTSPAALEPGRCPEVIRTERGYETCHLAEHDPGTRHHVRDRSWLSGGPTPCLRLCVPCGGACVWPDRVLRYLGPPPGAPSMIRPGGRPPRWAS